MDKKMSNGETTSKTRQQTQKSSETKPSKKTKSLEQANNNVTKESTTNSKTKNQIKSSSMEAYIDKKKNPDESTEKKETGAVENQQNKLEEKGTHISLGNQQKENKDTSLNINDNSINRNEVKDLKSDNHNQKLNNTELNDTKNKFITAEVKDDNKLLNTTAIENKQIENNDKEHNYNDQQKIENKLSPDIAQKTDNKKKQNNLKEENTEGINNVQKGKKSKTNKNQKSSIKNKKNKSLGKDKFVAVNSIQSKLDKLPKSKLRKESKEKANIEDNKNKNVEHQDHISNQECENTANEHMTTKNEYVINLKKLPNTRKNKYRIRTDDSENDEDDDPLKKRQDFYDTKEEQKLSKDTKKSMGTKTMQTNERKFLKDIVVDRGQLFVKKVVTGPLNQIIKEENIALRKALENNFNIAYKAVEREIKQMIEKVDIVIEKHAEISTIINT